jgi:hypothetical protein
MGRARFTIAVSLMVKDINPVIVSGVNESGAEIRVARGKRYVRFTSGKLWGG